jgi:hypothetical protein
VVRFAEEKGSEVDCGFFVLGDFQLSQSKFGSICGQLAAKETKNRAKTKTHKTVFSSQLSASRSIRCEEDGSETWRSARIKAIKNDPVEL